MFVRGSVSCACFIFAVFIIAPAVSRDAPLVLVARLKVGVSCADIAFEFPVI